MSTVAAARVSRASDLERRLAFLRDPRSYPGNASSVEAVETHLSWVFLVGDRAYKLKKPIRFDHLDLRDPAARLAHCRLEIRLNRRLAHDVYLDAIPLVRDTLGALRLGGDGEAVDWLVRMRRLPEALMLDHAIARGDVHPRDIDAIASTLAAFYRMCAPEPIGPAEWRMRLVARISENVRELAAPGSPLPVPDVHRVGERQVAAVEKLAAFLDRRVDEGLVVEGHGDLRPEHICLETPPRIIDCLEFSRGLRVVDAAEELGFLALECERQGAPELKARLFRAYAERSGDDPPAAIVHLYQSHHACVRAKLALRHLPDGDVCDPRKWIERARTYFALAEAHLEAAEES